MKVQATTLAGLAYLMAQGAMALPAPGFEAPQAALESAPLERRMLGLGFLKGLGGKFGGNKMETLHPPPPPYTRLEHSPSFHHPPSLSHSPSFGRSPSFNKLDDHPPAGHHSPPHGPPKDEHLPPGEKPPKTPMSNKKKNFLIGAAAGTGTVYVAHKATKSHDEAMDAALQDQATKTVGDAYGLDATMAPKETLPLLQKRIFGAEFLSKLAGKLHGPGKGGAGMGAKGEEEAHLLPSHSSIGQHPGGLKRSWSAPARFGKQPSADLHAGKPHEAPTGPHEAPIDKKGGGKRWLAAGFLAPVTVYGAYKAGNTQGKTQAAKTYEDTLGSVADYQIATTGDATAGGAHPAAEKYAQEQAAAKSGGGDGKGGK